MKALLAAVALAGCGSINATTPDDDESAYLVINARSVEQGRGIVDALQTDLPPDEFQKVRTFGPIADESPPMFVQFTGACRRDEAFVSRVRRIAGTRGVTDVRCTEVPPIDQASDDGPVIPTPNAEPRARLLLEPSSVDQGWDAVDAMRARLSAEDDRRIRSVGLVSSERSTVAISFAGDCATDAAFVKRATRLLRDAGVGRVSCGGELSPGS